MFVHSPVSQLADMLNARDNPWKPLAMIDCRAYFDDSGTHPSSTITVVGGYVATKDDWLEVERPWDEIMAPLKSRGIDAFHATDCLWRRKKYVNLTETERRDLYAKISDILETSKVQPICAAVRPEDWRAVVDAAPDFGEVYRTPLDFCVDRIIQQTVNWASNNARGSKVPIVIARKESDEADMDRTATSWFRVELIKDRVGPLSFAFPYELTPVQSADMLAHEVYRQEVWHYNMDNELAEPPEAIYPRCLDKIIRGRRMGGSRSVVAAANRSKVDAEVITGEGDERDGRARGAGDLYNARSRPG